VGQLSTSASAPVCALHFAAAEGHVEAMRVLVEELGADKEAKDVKGRTPMHWAKTRRQAGAVKALRQLGADVNAPQPSSVLADVLKARAAAALRQQERERLRKEQHRLRKVEEARAALRKAVAVMEDSAGSVEAVEEAMRAASKHEAHSKSLAALVAVARVLIEQVRAAESERTRVAAEAAAAEAVERQRLEGVVEALATRMQSDALQLQEAQAQLGVPPAAPAPHPDDAEEDQCVLCFDAPKDHIIIPCGHMCVCEACAKQLTQMKKPSCPICRGAIQHTNKVFQS
jgi:hypothetical protein